VCLTTIGSKDLCKVRPVEFPELRVCLTTIGSKNLCEVRPVEFCHLACSLHFSDGCPPIARQEDVPALANFGPGS
jgi:hypothetical protein